MKVDIREHPLLSGSWEVSYESEGEVSLVLFGGANAEKLAREYVKWKTETK